MSIVVFAAVIVMLGCFVAIVISGIRYSRRWMDNIELTVSFSEEQAGEGDSLYLYETVTNAKEMILPALCVKFKTSRYLQFSDMDSGSVSDYFYRNDVISVRGYEKVRRKLKVKCLRRGEYFINEAELVGNDYFLRQRYIEKKELDAKLVVYPSLVNVERMIPLFSKSCGELLTKRPIFEDPFEYVGVREYMAGDAMNRIHWKASARTGNWQVRTSAYKASEPVCVILNLESPGAFTNHAAIEENIRIAYSLIYYLDSQGITTTLVANGTDSLRASGNGRNHIANVRRQLACVQYESQIRNGQRMLQKEREKISEDTHVFFVSAAGKPEIQKELVEMVAQGISVTWVATSAGGEDDIRELLPGLSECVVRLQV